MTEVTDKLTKTKIINLLAEHLGVGEEDIHMEDSFSDDLHMSALDISGFVKKLETMGVERDSLDLAEMVTVEDLVEKIAIEEDLV